MQLKHASGFTLVELLLVLVIIGVAAHVTGPQLSTLMKNYRLNSAAKVVWFDLQKAKIMAIRQRGTVRIDFPPVSRTTTYNNPNPCARDTANTCYNIARLEANNTATVVVSRNLSRAYSNVTFSTTATTASVSFSDTGTVNNSSIVLQGALGSKRFPITFTGRIGCIRNYKADGSDTDQDCRSW
jgi:prepilin-type N-terminal cleavage/methylation domain-containing protein